MHYCHLSLSFVFFLFMVTTVSLPHTHAHMHAHTHTMQYRIPEPTCRVVWISLRLTERDKKERRRAYWFHSLGWGVSICKHSHFQWPRTTFLFHVLICGAVNRQCSSRLTAFTGSLWLKEPYNDIHRMQPALWSRALRVCVRLFRLYGVHNLPILPSQELNQDDKGKKSQACVSVGQSLPKVQSVVVVGAGRSAGCTILTAAGQTGAALASAGMERAVLAATRAL